LGEPERVFPIGDRTAGGALTSRELALVANKLLRRGFVLLPSDTGYSVAVIPHDADTRRFVNTLLGRPAGWPVSLAFSGMRSVRDYARLELGALHLLEAFTPGPITVVCPVSAEPGRQRFAAQALGAPDLTIGVRIPDSAVERDVAACTPYPITTAAVRDPAGAIVQSFAEAVEILDSASLERTGWYAIEGTDRFRSKHSTVVRVSGPTVELLRSGDIPFADIERISRELPAGAFENWG
jgi:L-threonylcarbamoyladenylate synthase